MKYVGSVAFAALSTAFSVHTSAQAKILDAPPTIFNLQSNVVDGTVTLSCDGKAPYAQLSCHVSRLWIVRPSREEWQKSRAALEADFATHSDDWAKQMQRKACASPSPTDREIAAKTRDYSAGRSASVRTGYAMLHTLCGCIAKQCIASAMLEQQTHEQNDCTVHSVAFPVDFVKVNARKWVSNNGPEGICGVVSVFSIEHDVQSTSLWTYREQHTYTNDAEGFCKGLKNEDTTYSWRSGRGVRLVCEAFTFQTLPEPR